MASTPLVFSTSFSSIPSSSKSHLLHHHPHLNSLPSFSSSLCFKSKQGFQHFPSNPLLFSQKLVTRVSSSEEHATTEVTDSDLVGEDSATFDLQNQNLSSWFYFTAILGVVLFVLNVIWIDDSTGFGKAFVDSISGISDSHEVIHFFSLFFLLVLNVFFYRQKWVGF